MQIGSYAASFVSMGPKIACDLYPPQELSKLYYILFFPILSVCINIWFHAPLKQWGFMSICSAVAFVMVAVVKFPVNPATEKAGITLNKDISVLKKPFISLCFFHIRLLLGPQSRPLLLVLLPIAMLDIQMI